MSDQRFKVGDWVRVTTCGRIHSVSDSHGLCYEVDLHDSKGRPTGYHASSRVAWFEPNEVSQPKIDDGWRGVAADMIAAGRFAEALDLLRENNVCMYCGGHAVEDHECP